MEKGVRIVTCFDEEYPPPLSARAWAPPRRQRCFFAGERALLDRPAVAVVGVSGVKTTPRGAPEHRGHRSRRLRAWLQRCHRRRTGRLPRGRLAGRGTGRARSSTCPPAACSATSARSRCAALSPRAAWRRFRWSIPRRCPRCPMPSPAGKLVFSLARAAFIFNTDGKRGEADAIKRGLCDWVYAYTGYPGNRALVSRGRAALPQPRCRGIQAPQRPLENGLFATTQSVRSGMRQGNPRLSVRVA